MDIGGREAIYNKVYEQREKPLRGIATTLAKSVDLETGTEPS